MAYTEKFISRVEHAYGKDSEVAEMARSGSYMLGRWLDDGSSGHIPVDYFFSMPLAEIIELARIEKEKSDLYKDWVKGLAYVDNDFELHYCPANYMQNTCEEGKEEYEREICEGVGYVGYYPGCARYSRKHLCWQKYHELKRRDERGNEDES